MAQLLDINGVCAITDGPQPEYVGRAEVTYQLLHQPRSADITISVQGCVDLSGGIVELTAAPINHQEDRRRISDQVARALRAQGYTARPATMAEAR